MIQTDRDKINPKKHEKPARYNAGLHVISTEAHTAESWSASTKFCSGSTRSLRTSLQTVSTCCNCLLSPGGSATDSLSAGYSHLCCCGSINQLEQSSNIRKDTTSTTANICASHAVFFSFLKYFCASHICGACYCALPGLPHLSANQRSTCAHRQPHRAMFVGC